MMLSAPMCPRCNNQLIYGQPACTQCGQPIDWRQPAPANPSSTASATNIHALQSRLPGLLLQGALWLLAGMGTLTLLMVAAMVVAPAFYSNGLYLLDTLITIVQVLVLLASILIFLIWLYSLHVDLNWFFYRVYPISPWGALARMIIPIVNIGGYWKIFSTFHDYLHPSLSGGTWGQRTFMFWVAAVYILAIPTYFIRAQPSLRYQSSGLVTDGGLLLLSTACNLALSVIYLVLTRIMMETLSKKASGALNT